MLAGREVEAIQKRYVRFAENEAKGVSPLYHEFALAVSQNARAVEFLLTLPVAKQQPNLLFAAVRAKCGVAANGDEFCELLLHNQEQVHATMLAKSTQTNEAARCALFLPILCRLPQPIALLEVGASAGLCLYPDRYGYRYGEHQIGPATDDAPTLVCRASVNTPLPSALPEVVWRAGVDLNPLDVTAAEDVAWLEHLIWPEQTYRLDTLRRAATVVAQDPPLLRKGDLLEELVPLAAQAPSHATLVVFHSAVLAYVADQDARDRFVDAVDDLDATWISNEHPAVFPTISSKLPSKPPRDQFLLSLNGDPLATTGPHGQSITWL